MQLTGVKVLMQSEHELFGTNLCFQFRREWLSRTYVWEEGSDICLSLHLASAHQEWLLPLFIATSLHIKMCPWLLKIKMKSINHCWLKLVFYRLAYWLQNASRHFVVPALGLDASHSPARRSPPLGSSPNACTCVLLGREACLRGHGFVQLVQRCAGCVSHGCTTTHPPTLWENIKSPNSDTYPHRAASLPTPRYQHRARYKCPLLPSRPAFCEPFWKSIWFGFKIPHTEKHLLYIGPDCCTQRQLGSDNPQDILSFTNSSSMDFESSVANRLETTCNTNT